MKRHALLLVIVLGTHARATQVSWEVSREKLDAMRGFLAAQDEAWRQRWPAALEFSVRYDTTTSAMQWEGVLAGRRMDARYLLSRVGGTNDLLSRIGVGHTRWLKCSGREWMEVAPHESGDSSRPWTATIMAESPTAYWKYAILTTAREPVAGIELGHILLDYPVLQMREDDRGVDVDFAVNAEVAKAVEEGSLDHIEGFIGLRARFERQCSWRPVEMLEIYNFPETLEGSPLAKLQTIDFMGSEARVFRRRLWTNFFKAASLDLPGAYSMESWVSTDLTGAYVEQVYVEKHSLAAKALTEVPPDAMFALEPPVEAGPCGKISNTITGDVTIVDSRGVHERMRSEDNFVRTVLEQAPKSVEQAGPGYRSLAAYICMFASAVLGGLFVVRTWFRTGRAA